MAEIVGKEYKARINDRIKAEDDEQGSKEDCDFGKADEDLPLLP